MLQNALQIIMRISKSGRRSMMYEDTYVIEKLSQYRGKELASIVFLEKEKKEKYPFYCHFSLFKNRPACHCSQLNL
ncbi:hypothetical protein B14911_27915 [Bacillus sp. NRRL B-14911]|nr:hypothetical protein B14911_27915 [Bacillus sp. NRRL B-14911]